jgi:hypothetical protein
MMQLKRVAKVEAETIGIERRKGARHMQEEEQLEEEEEGEEEGRSSRCGTR